MCDQKNSLTNTQIASSKAIVFSLLLICWLSLLTLGTPATIDDPKSVSTATREGRLAVFDDVWETIEERYYDPGFRGIDWQAKRLTYRPLAADAANTYEFYEVLRQMLASLMDPHTRVYSPEDKFDWWNPRFVTVGISVREIEGSPVVVHVAENSAAVKSHIRPGDVITAVDGMTGDQAINQRLQSLGLPRDGRNRSRAISTLLEGPAGTSVMLTWQAKDGKTKTANLLRSRTEKRLGFQISRRGKLAVIKIDVFTPTISRDLVRALPAALQDVRGIVLDLRANGGGDAQAMADVASAFVTQGINLGRFTDRSGVSFGLQTNLRMISALPSARQSKLPMVVLTSDGTSSAAEILAAVFQKLERARVIGSQTCGCVLAIRNRHELPDGGVLDVSELDYRTAEGLRLEGNGVTPDEVMTVTRRDIYKGRDAVLEYAAAYLNR